MIEGGFICLREIDELIEDINIVDKPDEILKEELKKI